MAAPLNQEKTVVLGPGSSRSRSASATSGPSPAGGTAGPSLTGRLLSIAWLAIVLGFAIEALLLAAAAGLGGVTAASPFIADLIAQTSWSFVVCMGIGIGASIGKARSTAMGVLGFLSAPAAFALARAAHQGASAALGLAGAPAGPSPFLLAGIKAAQYGLLGWVLGRLAERHAATLRNYAGLGLAAGILFGGLVLFLTSHAAGAPLSAAALLPRGIHELLFPVGCALVLWATEVFAAPRA